MPQQRSVITLKLGRSTAWLCVGLAVWTSGCGGDSVSGEYRAYNAEAAADDAERDADKADWQPAELESQGNVPSVDDTTSPAAPGSVDARVPQSSIKLLVKERVFQTEGPDGALRVSYDDLDLLKILNMDPVTPDAPDLLPQWLKSLDGQRIRLRGFMLPPFRETDLPAFVLTRDTGACCFGPNPTIYYLVSVIMRGGETTHYIQGRPFDVVGVFYIRPEVEDGKVYRLYEIDDAIIIE